MTPLEAVEEHAFACRKASTARKEFPTYLGPSLVGADLSVASLVEANLKGKDLCGAILYCAELVGADLRGAQLRGADLRGADLSGAELCGANLRDADLSGADLTGADLRGADLSGAKIAEGLVSASAAGEAGGYRWHALALEDGGCILLYECERESLAEWKTPSLEHWFDDWAKGPAVAIAAAEALVASVAAPIERLCAKSELAGEDHTTMTYGKSPLTLQNTLARIRAVEERIRDINDHDQRIAEQIAAVEEAARPEIYALECQLREVESGLQRARERKQNAVECLRRVPRESLSEPHIERSDLLEPLGIRVKGLLMQLSKVVPEWGELSPDSRGFSVVDHSEFRIDWEFGDEPHVKLTRICEMPGRGKIIPLAWLDEPLEDVVKALHAQLGAEV